MRQIPSRSKSEWKSIGIWWWWIQILFGWWSVALDYYVTGPENTDAVWPKDDVLGLPGCQWVTRGLGWVHRRNARSEFDSSFVRLQSLRYHVLAPLIALALLSSSAPLQFSPCLLQTWLLRTHSSLKKKAVGRRETLDNISKEHPRLKEKRKKSSSRFWI